MIKKIKKSIGLKKNINIKREFLAGLSGFLSIIYIIPLVISFYQDVSSESFPLFLSIVVVMGLSNILAAFLIKKPAIIGPSIAITLILTKTLIQQMNFSLFQVLFVLFLNSIMLLLLNFKNIGFKIITSIPEFFKKYLAIATGMYLIFIGFLQGNITEFNTNSISIGDILSKDFWFIILGVSMILFFYFKKYKYGIIVVVVSLSLIVIFGKYIFGWNYNGFGNYDEVFNFQNIDSNKYANGFVQGASHPMSYAFSFLIVLLTLIGLPGTCHPIAKTLGLDKNQENIYTKKIFKTLSISSAMSSFMSSGSPSIFAETMIVSNSKGKSGLTNIFIGIFLFLSISIAPLFPIFSNKIVTTPSLIFVGFLMVESTIKDLKFIAKEFIVGLIMICVSIFTNSIPQGLVFGFSTYVIIEIFSKKGKQISLYIYLLEIILILYEVLYVLIKYSVI